MIDVFSLRADMDAEACADAPVALGAAIPSRADGHGTFTSTDRHKQRERAAAKPAPPSGARNWPAHRVGTAVARHAVRD